MTSQAVMSGFPPAPAGQVTLANWRTPPFSRWAFQHVREILPPAGIAHEPGRARDLPEAPVDLGGLRVDGMGIDAFLAATDTDGIVVLRDGRVAFERYANGMDARTPHILMSVSKSMLGILAGILVARGVLDLDEDATRLVPEIARSAWRGARLRHLLDMRAGILFDENYLATSGAIIRYRKAQGWNPPDPGEAPTDLRGFFATLDEADGGHGGRFHYVSPNTDLLGWIIERATGERYADLAARLLWQPMGAAEPAFITVDRLGAPRCAGGFCATTRDLARVGLLLAEGGRRDGRQVVPAEWIDSVERDGDEEAWNRGDFAGYYKGMRMHYRSKWYVLKDGAPMLFGMGVNGQNLFVDRESGIVIAKFSSQEAAMDEARIALTMRGIAALRAELSRR